MNNFLSKHENFIMFIVLSIYSFAILFVLFFGIVGHCESIDGELPYTVSSTDYVNEDGYTLQNLQDFYNNRWGSYYPVDFFSDNVLIFEYDQLHGEALSYHYTEIFIPNSANSTYWFEGWSTIYDLFDYNTDSVTMYFNGYTSVTFSLYRNQYNDPSLNVYNGYFNTGLFHNTNRYPVYVKGDFFDNNNSNGFHEGTNIVLSDNVPYSPNIPTSGHATEPINNTGHLIPNVNPNKPTINNFGHSQPNYPNIDNSNTDTLLESLIDIVIYGFSFNNDLLTDITNYIMDNVENLTDYVTDSINRASNNIVGAIQDFATDFYNNMVSLFEPITTQLAYITEPVNKDIIVSGITDTGFYNGFDSTRDFFNTFDSIFDIPEPDSFTITIHLEELDFFNNGFLDFNLEPLVLNLGDNILPFRNTLRTFLWCAVSVGCIIFLQKNLPSMLKGDETGGASDGK